jgi:hypothetical protein
VSLAYDKDSKRYFEITDNERRDMLMTNGSVETLRKNRIKKYGSIEPLSPE